MLKITLRPKERIVINGCVLRNGERRQTFVVENHSDIVRERDLLSENGASTPVSRVYYLAQTALLKPDLRAKLVPEVHRRLAELAACFGAEMRVHILACAGHVSTGDFYKSLVSLRPVRAYETELLNLKPAMREDPATSGTVAVGA